MKTIFKKVSEIIENNEHCPIPLEVIPNKMGINLCSVEAVSWQIQDDGQLVNVSIYFKPAYFEKESKRSSFAKEIEEYLKSASGRRMIQQIVYNR